MWISCDELSNSATSEQVQSEFRIHSAYILIFRIFPFEFTSFFICCIYYNTLQEICLLAKCTKIRLKFWWGCLLTKITPGRSMGGRLKKWTEKAPTLRSRSLIRKEVNISEMLVRVVGSRTPRFTRQCVLPPDCTHIFKGVECGRICTSVKPLFRRLALLVSHTLIFEGEIVLLTFVSCYQAFRSRGLFPLTLHTYYTIPWTICQGFFESFFIFFNGTF